MAAPNSARKNNLLLSKQAILLAVALLLPGLAPSLFGWFSGLLATLVFFLLSINGQKKGSLLIRNGVLLAGAAAVFLKLLPTLLVSLAMVPLGYSFNSSYNRNESEILAGARGAVTLAASLFVFWIIYGMFQDMNPYQNLLEMLDSVFVQTYEYYRTKSDLPAETILQLEQAINVMRRIIPVVLPGLLSCTVLITVWINLLFSASLMARLQPEKTPWRKYSQWRLPDKLIWLLIGAGAILLIGQNTASQIGIAIFLAMSLLYFFQGLAVFIYLLEKWNVPVYLRILIYIILVIQSYGLILLIIAGVADVWFNFRQEGPGDNVNGT